MPVVNIVGHGGNVGLDTGLGHEHGCAQLCYEFLSGVGATAADTFAVEP